MIFYLLGMVVLSIWQVKAYQGQLFCPDYMGRDTTSSIKGISMLLIIASHFKQYVALDSVYDQSYLRLASFLGQTVVIMFLFYSGYGIQEAIKNKGISYVKKMPVKRIFITWFNFSIAVCLYILVNLILGKSYDLRTTLLAFTGWTSIGNSNWYIFAILVMYIVTWVSFLIFRNKYIGGLLSVTMLSGAYVIVLHYFRPEEDWWFNTIFCYVGGMWYSVLKSKIDSVLQKKVNLYYCALIIGSSLIFLLRPFITRLLIYEVWECIFVVVVVLITMKIRIYNSVLKWIGNHTFELYILQRIPMLLLAEAGLNKFPYLFLVISIIALFVMAVIFERVIGYMDRTILRCSGFSERTEIKGR